MVDQNTTTQDTPDNIVALRTRQFSDEQALAWLRERGRITAPASDLARVWGWHERRARRKLDSWKLAGWIRRKGKLITVVPAKSDTPISVKRTANGQAQTEQADANCATSDTYAALKSDTPTSVNRTGRSKVPPEAGLPELPPETSPLVPLPPLAVTERLAADLGHNNTRIDYLTASGRLLALGLAAVGLIANATFGASMGSAAWQQMLCALFR